MFQHDHLGALPALARKAPVMDPDLPQDGLPAICASRIEEMSSLIVGESHSEIAPERAAEHLARLRGNAGGNIKPHYHAAGPVPVLIDCLHDVRRRPGERPCKARPEQCVDNHVRSEFIHCFPVPCAKRCAIGLQDHLLCQGRTPCRRCFGREQQILHVIAIVCQKTPHGQSIRAVVAGPCQDRHPGVLRCSFHNLLIYRERRPFHQHDGRDSDHI